MKCIVLAVSCLLLAVGCASEPPQAQAVRVPGVGPRDLATPPTATEESAPETEDPPPPKEVTPAHEPDADALEEIVMNHDAKELLKMVEEVGPSLDAKPPDQLNIE